MVIETYTNRDGKTVEVQDMQWLEDRTAFDGTECSRYAVTDLNGEEDESVWLDEFDTEIDPYE